MPSPSTGGCLVIGRDLEATRSLSAHVGATLTSAPDASLLDDDWDWPWRDQLNSWERELLGQPEAENVAVCAWPDHAPAVAMADLDDTQWRRQVELPLATWFVAMKAAADRCRDGGSVVVVVERPASLDCAGRADLLAVADGLIALTRCAALIEGARGVRFNAVTTELFSAPEPLLGMPPPLRTFPGTAQGEVAGAVRMLWSPDAVGITGTVVRADCGRAW
jgi:NAD(P)-dependent dehydrogenase (short-subunit alcohol dehydrogenase family)